MYRFRL